MRRNGEAMDNEVGGRSITGSSAVPSSSRWLRLLIHAHRWIRAKKTVVNVEAEMTHWKPPTMARKQREKSRWSILIVLRVSYLFHITFLPTTSPALYSLRRFGCGTCGCFPVWVAVFACYYIVCMIDVILKPLFTFLSDVIKQTVTGNGKNGSDAWFRPAEKAKVVYPTV